MDKAELLKMEVGEVKDVNSHGHLVEIHRVFGGWIYVFESGSQFTSTFVPEELNVIAMVP